MNQALASYLSQHANVIAPGGIEEKSIHAAFTMAESGNQIVARQIISTLLIPDQNKVELLGFLDGGVPAAQSAAPQPLQQPAPQYSAPIPAAPAVSIPISRPEAIAFQNPNPNLNQSASKIQTTLGQRQATEGLLSEIVASKNAPSLARTAPTTQILDEIVASPMQSSPVNVPLEQERVFQSVAETVTSSILEDSALGHIFKHPDSATQKDINDIPVIKSDTDEKFVSEHQNEERLAEERKKAERAKPQFEQIEGYLKKAYSMHNPDVIMSAQRQFNNLLERNPEYQNLYPEHVAALRAMGNNFHSQNAAYLDRIALGEEVVGTGMTITAESKKAYTVTSIMSQLGKITIMFRDSEMKEYAVPDHALLGALADDHLDTDEFFKKWIHETV